MATVSGTVQGVSLLDQTSHGAAASGLRMTKVFKVDVSTAAANANDVLSLTSLQTTIKNKMRNGRSFTITTACAGAPGTDASGAAVYPVGTVTAGTTAGQVDLKLGTGPTASATVNAGSGVSVIVAGYES